MRLSEHLSSKMLWACGTMVVISGCAGPAKPIFEPPPVPIVWPPAPQTARIRFIGELRAAEDLKPPKRAGELLGTIFGGRKEIRPLYGPRAVICTQDGQRLWVADPGGRCIHIFDLASRGYRKIVRVGDGPLLSPVGVCAGPSGSIYVCDSERVAIYRFADPDGKFLESLRLPEDLLRPVGVYYDAGRSELYVVDAISHDLKVLDPNGNLKRVLGRRGGGTGEFNFPSAITADDQWIWITDTGNHRVQAMNREGEPVASFGQAGDAPGDLELPKGVAIDGDGHVYVVDGRFENVQIFSRKGELLLTFGEEGTGRGEFWLPGGIAIDALSRIWVCDSYNRRVQVFQYLRDEDAK